MVDIVFVCRNLFSVLFLKHRFFWLSMLYQSQGIAEQLPESADGQSGLVAESSCRSGCGSGVECLDPVGVTKRRMICQIVIDT